MPQLYSQSPVRLFEQEALFLFLLDFIYMERQEPLSAYTIGFDRADSFEIRQLDLPERLKREQEFSSYIASNVGTLLGERFNVSLSSFTYDIKEGQLWGQDMNEPFMDTLKRGRDYRREHGNPVDFARESAEVVGFEKIQTVLLDPETPVGTMMLSISLPGKEGSTYTKNFKDVHRVMVDEKTQKRYVESTRYATSLSLQEYQEKLTPFVSLELDGNDPAASLLEQPIAIQNTLTPDDLQEYFEREKSFMSVENLELIKEHCSELIEAFSRSLIEQPENEMLHEIIFNTIINKADSIARRIKEGDETVRVISKRIAVQDDVELYGFEPVEEIMGGCGVTSGYSVSAAEMGTPPSVAIYGKDKYGERTFNCPECFKENVRPYNTLLAKCQHCKSKKVAC